MRYVLYFASVRNDLTASNVKLAQMKPEKFQLRGQRNVGCVHFGCIPFRGFLKGNLRASSGIVTGECALFSQVANQGKRGDFVCGILGKEVTNEILEVVVRFCLGPGSEGNGEEQVIGIFVKLAKLLRPSCRALAETGRQG